MKIFTLTIPVDIPVECQTSEPVKQICMKLFVCMLISVDPLLLLIIVNSSLDVEYRLIL